MQLPTMKRIAVDFDGTLVEERWPELGDWLPGAVDALKKLALAYDEVVIFSCRLARMDTDEFTPRNNMDQIIAMNDMLEQANIPKNVILWTKDYKPAAEFYVDDKAVRFNGDWDVTTAAVIGGGKYATDFDPGDEQDERPYPPEMFNADGNYVAAAMRTFETGATRDTDEGKPSYVSYLSPLALKSFGEYMLEHELQPNGERREPGNWKRGMPKQAYLESHFRHLIDLWLIHDGYESEARESIIKALNAMLFNTFGYLHTLLEESLLD